MDASITGIITGVAMWAARETDEFDRRINRNSRDARDAMDAIRTLYGRGDIVRSRLPVVQDWQVGLSVANPVPPSPQVVPSLSTQGRDRKSTRLNSSH